MANPGGARPTSHRCRKIWGPPDGMLAGGAGTTLHIRLLIRTNHLILSTPPNAQTLKICLRNRVHCSNYVLVSEHSVC